jgi:hypothetical protein
MMLAYGVTLALTATLLSLMPAQDGLQAELRRLNWASYLVALAIVGVEAGFLLVYRWGCKIGLAAVLVNVIASLVLVPVALLVLEEHLNWVKIA